MNTIITSTWDAILFPNIHGSHGRNFSQSHNRMGSLHRKTYHHRHFAIRRPSRTKNARCLSSLFPGCLLGNERAVETFDDFAGQDILPSRCNTYRSGRHPVSSQWQKSQWCRLVARCGSFDRHKYSPRMGTEYCGSYAENKSALGWRTFGFANRYETSPKGRAHSYKTGQTDAHGSCPLAASKAFSVQCGDLLGKKRKKTRGRPRKRGKKLSCPQNLAKRIHNWQLVETCERGKSRKRLVYTRKVVWYRVSQKPVLLVISRDPAGKEKDDFFFTTDLSLTAAEVISGFAGRWSIEDTFKNTKQFIGGQEPQTWKRKGPERAAALSLWIYSAVWLWYLQQKSKRRYFFIQPWHPGKSAPSFADALSCLRRVLWQDRIKFMFGKRFVHNKNFEFLIEALAAAA